MILPSGLNTRFIRLIAALIIPGAIVAVTFTPFAFGLWKDELKWIGSASQIAQGTGFFFLSVLFSILLEDAGSRIEEKIYKRRKSDDDDVNWYHYLLRQLDHDCIMVRYIGELVMRLKFEISLMMALPLSLFFWICHLCQEGGCICCKLVVPFVVVVFTSLWMWREAVRTVDLLMDLRKRMKESDDQALKIPAV
jgi:membrane protein implicated in regulation of membrane protease activity